MAAKEKKHIIKFTRDYTVQDERVGTAEEETYKKGMRKAFPLASAKHFVSRGAAEYVNKPPQD